MTKKTQDTDQTSQPESERVDEREDPTIRISDDIFKMYGNYWATTTERLKDRDGWTMCTKREGMILDYCTALLKQVEEVKKELANESASGGQIYTEQRETIKEYRQNLKAERARVESLERVRDAAEAFHGRIPVGTHISLNNSMPEQSKELRDALDDAREHPEGA